MKTLEFSSVVLPTLYLYRSVYHYVTDRRQFNGLFSGTTWVSQYQKGLTNLVLMKQEMMGWQWHQLDHMQIICTSLQTDNHASTSSLIFYRPDALHDAHPTVSKH